MKDKEAKSLTKQLTRYAKVGGVVGKLATKLASQRYLGVKLDKEKHASEIRAALGSIKGPLMKVAQLSATIPDLLPDEYAQELMHLQSKLDQSRLIKLLIQVYPLQYFHHYLFHLKNKNYQKFYDFFQKL